MAEAEHTPKEPGGRDESLADEISPEALDGVVGGLKASLMASASRTSIVGQGTATDILGGND